MRETFLGSSLYLLIRIWGGICKVGKVFMVSLWKIINIRV